MPLPTPGRQESASDLRLKVRKSPVLLAAVPVLRVIETGSLSSCRRSVPPHRDARHLRRTLVERATLAHFLMPRASFWCNPCAESCSADQDRSCAGELPVVAPPRPVRCRHSRVCVLAGPSDLDPTGRNQLPSVNTGQPSSRAPFCLEVPRFSSFTKISSHHRKILIFRS
jgi:hypothetical protein